VSTSFEGESGGLVGPSHVDHKSRPRAVQCKLEGRCSLFEPVQMSNWELLVRTRVDDFGDGALNESRTDTLPKPWPQPCTSA
jgi:hypothetical protein